MLITISGPSGSGKSSTAKLLSKELRIPTVDVGTIFRAMAKRHGMDVIAFGKYVARHPDIDRKLDEEMIRLVKRRKKLILQGRLSGWMTRLYGVDAIRVWIAGGPQVRASRIAGREHIPYRSALRGIVKRDRDNRIRYKRIYGLDLNDTSIYDIVVPTNNRSLEQVVSLLLNKLRRIWPTRQKQPQRQRKIRKMRLSPPKRRQPPPKPRRPRK